MAGGDRTTDADQELIARLDQAFAHQRDLDPVILASVRAWQRTDRTYELVQRIARSRSVSYDVSLPPAARTVQRHLEVAIRSGSLPFRLRVFRGLRDTAASLGVERPRDACGRRIDMLGFFATTVFREVATDEFTGQRGVLLDLSVPSGARALWVAGAGDDALRRQGELLLGSATQIQVYSHVRRVNAVSVLQGEVVLDE